MLVLIVTRVGVAVFKVITMAVICIAFKRLMAINVAIVAIVVLMFAMNAAVTVIMSAIVITSMLKKTTTVVVVGRIVNTVITGVISIIINSATSIIAIMAAICMTATSVCANVVNRKNKLLRRAAIRTTAPSRGATSPFNFSWRANVGSESVAPAQKAARDDGPIRFLMSETYTVFQRSVGVSPEGGCPQWIYK